MYFRYFVISPFRKGRDPSFEQSWTPFVPSLVEIGPSGFGEEDDNVKSLRRQRPEKLTWAFESGELKGKRPMGHITHHQRVHSNLCRVVARSSHRNERYYHRNKQKQIAQKYYF